MLYEIAYLNNPTNDVNYFFSVYKGTRVKDNTLDVKDDLFCEEELVIVLKGLKIIRLLVLIVW